MVVALKASISFSAEYPQKESVGDSPLYIRSWYQAFYEEDSKGSLSSIKDSMDSWNYLDEMADNHGLPIEVRGNVKGRRGFITNNMLKSTL